MEATPAEITAYNAEVVFQHSLVNRVRILHCLSQVLHITGSRGDFLVSKASRPLGQSQDSVLASDYVRVNVFEVSVLNITLFAVLKCGEGLSGTLSYTLKIALVWLA